MDFKDLKKKFVAIGNQVVNKQTMTEIGQNTAKQIRTRTRLGRGVDQTPGKFNKLKPLKDSTKKVRKQKQQAGKLSNETKPSKSNLTDTGSMLDSIRYEASNTEVRIYIEGAENKKKANDQVAQGRRFMNLSKTELAEITRYLTNKIITSFNKG